jgi:hypothetical protein
VLKFNTSQSANFKELFNSMMDRRWFITTIVLVTFLLLTIGIVISVHINTEIGQAWKELLLLMLGAFIGSYGKIIDYWFNDLTKDKMMVQKIDEEDGITLSNTLEMDNVNSSKYIQAKNTSMKLSDKSSTREPNTIELHTEIDENGDGISDGIDYNGDGIIDEYFEHRYCTHEWVNGGTDSDLECVRCGRIKDDTI